MWNWLVNHKTFALILCGALGLGGIIFAANWYIDSVYDDGYQAGVQYVSDQVEQQKQQWNEQVQTIQKDHEVTIASMVGNYRNQIDKLNAQIDTLKNNPKIITKYITVDSKVPQGFVLWHDRAVQNTPFDMMIDEQENCNAESSYTLTQAATTIASNYINCNTCYQRLSALQEVVNDFIAKQNQLSTKEQQQNE